MRRIILNIASAALATSLLCSWSFANEELLEPEKAFALSTETQADNSIVVRWDIADGYYMYRDKFSFAVVSPQGASLSEPEFEKGKIKEDELFGDVEVYEDSTQITFALLDPTEKLELEITGQGCNEPIGVCYPPMKQVVALNFDGSGSTADGDATNALLAKAVGSNSSQSPSSDSSSSILPQSSPVDGEDTSSSKPQLSIGSLKTLNGLIGNDGSEFLDVDEAFKLDLTATEGGLLKASFEIAEGYYLYRDQTSFRAADADLGAPEFPDGVSKTDETYGESIVYYDQFNVPVPIRALAEADGIVEVEAVYQGCAEDAICYPPVTKAYSVRLPPGLDTSALLAVASADTSTTGGGTLGGTSGGSAAGAGNAASTALSVDSLFSGKSFWGLIIAAFGVGVLLTFTPCVLPLIPILSGIIAGQGENITRARGGMLAIAYVLGTAVTYAAIGAVAGATGEQLQAYFQNVWAIGAIAVVFVLMSLSMFGLFNIEMPAFIQSRIQSRTESLGGGVLGGTFVLGMFSALIVGACVSPLLIAALSVAIARGDAVLGASMMVAMALGMGVFLIIIGYGAGSLIPKAGAWMDRVKQGFGVMLLALAIYLLQVIPQVPVLLLWAVLLIVVAVYLGATQALPDKASGWRYFYKGIGTVMLVWGIAALVGGFSGQRDILNPLPALGGFSAGITATGQTSKHAGPEFINVRNVAEFDNALASANAEGRYVMLDYYADWCTDCKRMEANTLANEAVMSELDDRFVLLQVDVTDPKDADGVALKKKFGVYGPPAILFFGPDGNEISQERFYGFKDVEQFLEILSRARV